MRGFLLRSLISALGLWLAARLVPSIRFDSDWTLLWAAVMLGVVNAVVRPLFVVLTFPITIVTLGLFLMVGGFVPALLGSLIVSFTGWLGSWFIGSRGRLEVMVVRGRREVRPPR